MQSIFDKRDRAISLLSELGDLRDDHMRNEIIEVISDLVDALRYLESSVEDAAGDSLSNAAMVVRYTIIPGDEEGNAIGDAAAGICELLKIGRRFEEIENKWVEWVMHYETGCGNWDEYKADFGNDPFVVPVKYEDVFNKALAQASDCV